AIVLKKREPPFRILGGRKEIPMVTRASRAAAIAMLCAIAVSPGGASAGDGVPRVTTIPAPGGGQPVVARIDAQGVVHLLYNSARGPWYAKSNDSGRTFNPAIPVLTKGPGKPGLQFYGPGMAVGRGGRIHVAMSTNAWQLKLPEEEWAFYYASLEPAARAFSPVRNLNRKPSEGYSLAADGKGNVTACWLSGKLYANVSHDDG